METLAAALLLPMFCLLGMVLVPSRIANRHASLIRQTVTALVGLAVLAAALLAVMHAALGGQPRAMSIFDAAREAGFGVVLYYDGAASLMLLLVSFVGYVVSRFSIRYLDGEAAQGRYFRWLGFLIGSVSLMVVAGDLLLFFLAWVMTSFGLHQLLLHYPDRPAAHRAAWTKFAISRLGDLFLIAAVFQTWRTFGTWELSTLFAQAELVAASSQVTASHAAIGGLLVLGAITKSAQFPFHTWLPDTMETPTPVSALMHAGIVNAGGYLIIRMSPLVALAPTALAALAVMGAFTACFAGIVMMVQPSIKRTLAYSTIAQMGFMMLQCGLGAFSAAMLHILAHSLYKAHAFLTSGSVLSQSLASSGAKMTGTGRLASIACLMAAAAAAVSAFIAISVALGLDVTAKSGGLVLGFLLCAALATWSWRLFALGEPGTALAGVAGVAGLCLVYFGSYLAVDRLLSPSVAVVDPTPFTRVVHLGIAAAFCLLFALHALVVHRQSTGWLESLRVHAVSGFYIDAVYHRLFRSLSKS
jgi:NAD(P)H-quinone oxidoreductase subunit 5